MATKVKKAEFAEHQELMNDLAKSFYISDGRTPLDRYRDFKAVFLGTDAGKRVLYEILAWGAVYRQLTPDHGPVDTNRHFIEVGKRHLAIDILNITNQEPVVKEKPKSATRRKPDARI